MKCRNCYGRGDVQVGLGARGPVMGVCPDCGGLGEDSTTAERIATALERLVALMEQQQADR